MRTQEHNRLLVVREAVRAGIETHLAYLKKAIAETARAIDYALRRWTALLRYLDDGTYLIDNNPVENAICPVALGRKNWLFAGTEAAKLNGHDPFAYLRDVLTRLPTHPYRRIDELLPFNWTPAASYTLLLYRGRWVRRTLTLETASLAVLPLGILLRRSLPC